MLKQIAGMIRVEIHVLFLEYKLETFPFKGTNRIRILFTVMDLHHLYAMTRTIPCFTQRGPRMNQNQRNEPVI